MSGIYLLQCSSSSSKQLFSCFAPTKYLDLPRGNTASSTAVGSCTWLSHAVGISPHSTHSTSFGTGAGGGRNQVVVTNYPMLSPASGVPVITLGFDVPHTPLVMRAQADRGGWFVSTRVLLLFLLFFRCAWVLMGATLHAMRARRRDCCEVRRYIPTINTYTYV